jgi:acyl carrier protein
MTETEQGIADILEHIHAVRAARIRPETFINKDLGVDGDDAVDLLREIQKRFQIDLNDFQVDRYFGPESWDLAGLLRKIFRGEKLRLEPLSVRELGEYVDRNTLIKRRN